MKPSHALLRNVIAGSLFLTGSLLFTSVAQATECKADGDCGEGYRCQIISTPIGVPCAAGEECAPPETDAETSGICVRKPITCQTDADCPSYLKCEEDTPDVSCGSPGCPDGNCGEQPVECTPSEPADTTRTCRPREIECETDSQCPSNFECVSYAVSGCAGTSAPCAEGQECPSTPDECQETEQKACMPKLIECESNAGCPSDWECTSYTTRSDDCLDTSISDDPAEPPTPGTPAAKCENITRSICIPPGFDVGYDNVGEDGSSNEAPTSESAGKGSNSTPSDASASGDDASDGCAVAHVGGSSNGTALLSLLGLGLVARLANRRARRA